MATIEGPTLGLGIDASKAEKGARDFKRATDSITKESDKAEKSVGNVSTKITSFGKSLGTLGASLGIGIGVTSIVGGLSKIVKEVDSYQLKVNQLNALIDTTGGAAKRSASDIENLAQEIGIATLASVNEVRDVSAQLLTFKSISGTVFDDTLRLAQDLASVGFGTLSSSAVQLAKALEDPAVNLSNLRRVGISFTQQQVEMIKALDESGRKFEAQKQILQAVRDQVGGAGAAAAQGTLVGAYDTLIEKMGIWIRQSETGRAVTDALTASMQALANAVPDFSLRGRIENLQSEIERKQGFRGIAGANAARQIPGLIQERDALLEQERLNRQLKQLSGLNLPSRSPGLGFSGSPELPSTRSTTLDRVYSNFLKDQTKDTNAATTATKALARHVSDYLGTMERGKAAYASFRAAQDEALNTGIKLSSDYRERLFSMGAAIRNEVATPTERLQEEISRLNQLFRVGAVDSETYSRKAALLATNFQQSQLAAYGLDQTFQQLGFSAQSAFEDAILSGNSLRDVMRGLLQDIARLALRSATSPIFGFITSGLSNLVSSAIGSAVPTPSFSVPTGYSGSSYSNGLGFASGGSFNVGGNFGVDKNIVPLRLSRGERVDITPAREAATTNGDNGNIYITQNTQIHPDVSLISRQVFQQEFAKNRRKIVDLIKAEKQKDPRFSR